MSLILGISYSWRSIKISISYTFKAPEQLKTVPSFVALLFYEIIVGEENPQCEKDICGTFPIVLLAQIGMCDKVL